MEKLESGSGFYDPIKKLKLQTFSVWQKRTVFKAGTNRELVLKADNRVFGQMLLIALTFEEVSNTVLNKVLSDGRGSSRVDVVFDIYQEKSIKTAERAECGSKLGIVFS